jgi:cold-inducible RNA-binding protein
MNLYVSNLAYTLTDEELQNEFAAYGTVAHARVVKDRETGRSRGFGFVDMPNDDEARAAMDGLNNAAVGGRPLKVVEARPKEERPQRPGGPPPPRSGGGGDRRGGGPPPRKDYGDDGWRGSDDRRGGGGDRRGGGGGGRGGDRGFSRGGKRDFGGFDDDF